MHFVFGFPIFCFKITWKWNIRCGHGMWLRRKWCYGLMNFLTDLKRIRGQKRKID